MAELNRLSSDEYQSAPKLPITLVLDNIRSCHNIGSIFRTADALLVEKLILCGITATPPDKEIHKTALDAEKTVSWEYFEDTMEAVRSLKQNGYTVYAVEQVVNSHSLPGFYPGNQEKIALIFGNEVKGVSQEVVNQCDGAIRNPPVRHQTFLQRIGKRRNCGVGNHRKNAI